PLTLDTRLTSGQSRACKRSSRISTASASRAIQYGGDCGKQGSLTSSPSGSTTSLTSTRVTFGLEGKFPGSAAQCWKTGLFCTSKTKLTSRSQLSSARLGASAGRHRRLRSLANVEVLRPCLLSVVEATSCSDSTRNGSHLSRSSSFSDRC